MGRRNRSLYEAETMRLKTGNGLRAGLVVTAILGALFHLKQAGGVRLMIKLEGFIYGVDQIGASKEL